MNGMEQETDHTAGHTPHRDHPQPCLMMHPAGTVQGCRGPTATCLGILKKTVYRLDDPDGADPGKHLSGGR